MGPTHNKGGMSGAEKEGGLAGGGKKAVDTDGAGQPCFPWG